MRYNFYTNKVEDVKLTIALEIVRGKYAVSESLPSKNQLAKEYDVSRPTIDIACGELESLNVISRYEADTGAFSVPYDTTAAQYVAAAFARKMKECSRMLQLLGFGARESREQLYIKQIINTLPKRLKELENEGKIYVHAQDKQGSAQLFSNGKPIMDESIFYIPTGYQDIVQALEEML